VAQFFTVHPVDPQPRLVRQAAEIVRAGGVIVYPTDSCYALGCRIGDKEAMQRIRTIRHIDARHHFALVCRDLSEISTYARMNDQQFRLLKVATPGSYTFILRATAEVPKRLQHPSRRTIGVRVPDHRIVAALLAELGEPIVSSTLLLPDEAESLNDPLEIRRRLEHQVDLVIDGGSCGVVPTTVVQLTDDVPVIVRTGKGDTAILTR
jgi:tRNA threonylcarbamoyl adenosine modification protein (Sua5/YciO/YrdC/YwlC family)